jgi:hypothetical protein
MTEPIRVPTLFAIEAALTLQPSTGDDRAKSFSVVGYDGGKLNIDGFRFPVVVDLATARTKGQVKALWNHDSRRPVGHYERVQFGDTITADGVLSIDSADRDQVLNSAAAGFKWEASIGTEPNSHTSRFIPAKQSITVNGRKQAGPFVLASNAIVAEISFVGKGGGQNTTVQIAAASKWSDDMPSTITASGNLAAVLSDIMSKQAQSDGDTDALVDLMAEASGLKPDEIRSILDGSAEIPPTATLEKLAEVLEVQADRLTDAATADIPADDRTETDDTLPPTPAASTPEETNVPTPTAETATATADANQIAANAKLETEVAGLRGDLQRMNTQSDVARLRRNHPRVTDEQAAEIQASAVEKGWNENEIDLAFFRKGGNAVANYNSGNPADAPGRQQVIQAAFGLNYSFNETETANFYGEDVTNEAITARWRGFGLHSLFATYLQASGYHLSPGTMSDVDFQEAVRLAAREPRTPQAIQAAGFSTFSLPTALGDFGNKEMQRAFDAVKQEIRAIAYRTSSSNFQPKKLFRLSMADGLQKVGRNGQLSSVDLKEQAGTVQAEQWGRKLTISYADARDDDAGGFSELARMFGNLGASTVESEMAAVLLANPNWTDGVAFFHTSRGNILSGAGSAFSLAALETAFASFLVMETVDGNVQVTLDPENVLVNPGAAVLAMNVNNSTNVVVAGSSDVEKPQANPFVGMFTPRHSRYLGNAKVANANGTQWFLNANPAVSSPIAVTYLDNRDTPEIRTWDAIPGHTGMQWDAVLSWGTALHDPYAAIYNVGQ